MDIEGIINDSMGKIRVATTNISSIATFSEMPEEVKENIQKEVRDIIAALNPTGEE